MLWGGWQNQLLPQDVSAEDVMPSVTLLDAQLIHYELDHHVVSDPVTGKLPEANVATSSFLDVSGDGFVSPLDVKLVYDYLYRHSARDTDLPLVPLDATAACGTGMSTDLFASTISANSSGPADAVESRVNSTTKNVQDAPSVAISTQGTIIVWESHSQDSSAWGIYGQRYNTAGAKIGNEFRINVTTRSSQHSPRVDTWTDGRFVVVWEGIDQQFDSGWGVYARLYNSDGTPATDELHINQTTNGTQRFPAVAVLTDGSFAVSWEGKGTVSKNHKDDDNSNGEQEIFVRKFSSAGAALGTEIRVNASTTGTQEHAAIAALPGGGFAVAYNGNGPGDRSGIFLRRFAADATAVGNDILVNSSSKNGDQRHAALDVSPDGTILVAWSSTEDQRRWDVYGQLIDDTTGAPIGSAIPISQTIAGTQWHPSVAALKDGTFVVAWEGYSSGDEYGIYTRQIGANGSRLTDEKLMNWYRRCTQKNPAIAGSGNSFVIAWDGLGPGDTSGVFSQGTKLVQDPANQPPLNSLPAVQVVDEDSILVFSSANQNAISITDPDAGEDPVKLTLSVTTGSITLSTLTGLNFLAGDGVADSTMGFLGSLASINAALSGLVFLPPSQFNGSASLTITTDDQGHNGTGGAKSDTDSLTINVFPVNDAPSFNKGPDITVNEDSGLQSLISWATSISPGPANEADQAVAFAVTNNGQALFSKQPTISSNGILTFTPADNAFGTAQVSVTLIDSGGTDHNGHDTSPVQTFFINITPVNDAPSFTKGADQLAAMTTATQTVAGWATNVSPGPPNESGDILSFLISTDNNALFTLPPTVSPNGTLTYALTPKVHGSATVTVRLKDNGGITNGGQDTSPWQSFMINVAPANSLPAIQDLSLVNDTARSGGTNNDRLTRDPTIRGTVLNDLQIAKLSAAFGSDRYADVFDTLQPDGSFVLNRSVLQRVLGGPLADGPYLLNLQAEDVWGNVSNMTGSASSLPFVLDTLVANFSLGLAPEFDSAPAGDDETDRKLVSLVGQTEPAALVTLPGVGSAIADASGVFRFDNVSLSEGVNLYQAHVEDIAGNTADYSKSITRHSPYLTDWTVTETGGSSTGHGSGVVQDGNVHLLEGDSFTVTAQLQLTTPAHPSVLTFVYSELAFDTASQGRMKDAFEVTLLDANDNLVVHSIVNLRDGILNVTEGQALAQGPEVTVDGQRVNVDLAGLAPGNAIRLVVRLVNNDGDVTSSLSIGQVDLLAAPVTPPGSLPSALVPSRSLNAPVDFAQLSDISASFQVDYGRTSFNQRSDILYAQAAIKNIGQYAVDAPLLVGITHISNPLVRLRNIDGLTPDGIPYIDFSRMITSKTILPGASTDSLDLSFFNPGAASFTYDLVFLGHLNQVPTITSQADVEALIGREYRYAVQATDPEDDRLTYSLSAAPAGMTINASTGVITWNPTSTTIGTHDVTVLVDDGRGGATQQHYLLAAMSPPPNRPPVIVSEPVTFATATGDLQHSASKFSPGQLFVSSSKTHTIRVYDSETLQFVRSFSHPSFADAAYSPAGLAFNSRGNLIVATDSYLVEFSDYGVEFARYPKVTAERSENIAFDSFGNLYTTTATGGTNQLNQYRASDYSFVQTISLPDVAGSLAGIVFDPFGRLFVASQSDNRIYVLQADQNFSHFSLARSFPGPAGGFSGTEGLQFNFNGELIAAAGDIFRYDPNDGRLIGSFDAPNDYGPVPLVVDVTGRIFAADFEDGIGSESGDLFRFAPDGSSFVTKNDGQLFGPFGLALSGATPLGLASQFNYHYDVEAIDVDSDSVVYSLVQDATHVIPLGMVINGDTGEIKWSPTAEQIGEHSVTVRVTDGHGGINVQTFSILVGPDPTNHSPVIISDAITQATIDRGVYRNAVLSESGLVDYWRLDETTGAVAKNEVAGRNPGQYLGGITLGQVSGGTNLGTVPELDGIAGSAIRVDLAPLPAKLSQFSVEAWVYADDFNDSFKSIVTGLTFDFSVRRTGSTTGVAELLITTTDGFFRGYSTQLATGQWYHLVGSYDGSNLLVYTNGIAGAITPTTGQIINATDKGFIGAARTGNDPASFNWSGRIDEVALYDEPLTSQRVTAHYAAATNNSVNYSYNVGAVDSDNDSLNYSLTTSPPGMTIDPRNGAVSWNTPSPMATFISSPSGLSIDGAVDWGILGMNGAVVNNPFSVPVIAGLNVTVSKASGDFGILQSELGWSGSFVPGDMLLSTGAGNVGSVTLNFDQPIAGFGTQLQAEFQSTLNPPLINAGKFQARITAFDSNHNLIGDYSSIGDLTNALDGSAPFLGIRSPTANIRQISISVPQSDGLNLSFALNGLKIQTNSAQTDSAIFPVTVRVDDGRGGFDTQSFGVNVTTGALGEIRGTIFNDRNNDGAKQLPGKVSTTFNTGSDGWTSVTLPYPEPGAPPSLLATYEPEFRQTGGNPAGYAFILDPDGDGATGNVQYWRAPTGFLGNQLRSYGGTLSFDLLQTSSGYGYFDQEDVILVGGNRTLVYDVPANPAVNLWTAYTVPLSETGWRNDTLNGAPATQSEMAAVLSSLTAIYIRGEYLLGPDGQAIDNVELLEPQVDSPLNGWTVYLDQNQNGQRDNNEQFTTTDANGEYVFKNLAPGNYTVREVGLPDWLQTFPGDGAQASTTVNYVDWTSADVSNGTASGVISLPGGSTVNVGFEAVFSDNSPGSLYGAQIDGGINYWIPSTPYISEQVTNPPTGSDILKLIGGTNQIYRITLSEPIVDPIMSILSLGSDSIPITYDFDSPFSIVSQGAGYWGGSSTGLTQLPGDVLSGREGHGTIKFLGTFSSFSWTVPNPEGWHGFTFGIRSSLSLARDGYHTVNLSAGENETGVDFGNKSKSNSTQNRSPSFINHPPETANVSELYRYNASAYDPDGNTLNYDLAVKPEGMAVDPLTGVLVWRPTADQVGPRDVVLRVRDGKGGVALQSFQVIVRAANNVPVVTSMPKGPAVVGLPYQYQVNAQDADGDTLGFLLLDPPLGMTVNSVSGLVSWTPAVAQIGDQPVSISVSDGQGGTVTQSFTLGVVASAKNDAPTITSVPTSAVALGRTYRYQVAAIDPNGDPLTFSLIDNPSGLTITPTGLVQWTPTATQLGAANVALHVDDGRGGFSTQSFAIKVATQLSNDPPQIVSLPLQSATAGNQYAYNPVAVDVNGDQIFWSFDTAPRGMSIDATQGFIRWTPSVDQSGLQTLILRATDAQGAAATQTFSVEVFGGNRPPSITSFPPTAAVVGQSYGYALKATDSDGDSLVYSLLVAPGGMTIDANSGFINWTPTSEQAGIETVTVQVADGNGGINEQTYGIGVNDLPPNNTPKITSSPNSPASVGSLYQYAVTATDSDNDTLTFALPQAPAGMTINAATGQIQWTPITAQLGLQQVKVTATDPLGAQSTQTFSLRVLPPNHDPTITSTPSGSVSAGAIYRYDVRSIDPDGDLLAISLVTAPEGMSLDNLGRIRWTTTTANIGTVDVGVRVSDGRGGVFTQSFPLQVVPDTQSPNVLLTLTEDPIKLGDTVTIQLSATDDTGVVSRSLAVNGTPVLLNSLNQGTFVASTVGPLSFTATAIDEAGNIGHATLASSAYDPSVTGAPILAVISPTTNAVITGPINVTGTVDDPDLAFYQLEIGRVDTDVFKEIAHGTTAVLNGVLGQIDPSLLSNDTYILRLTAKDTGLNTSVEEVTLNVAGDLKLGNFTLSFTDLSVPVSGIPIVLGRTYDSLNAQQSNDFGYGWRLEFRDTDLRTSVEQPSAEEREYLIYKPFFDGARVYVTVPGGKREGFTFRPQPGPFFSILKMWKPHFEPDPGVTSQLTVPDFPLMRTADGDFVGYTGGGNYNPANPVFGAGNYTLTTKEGIVYEINGDTGKMESVADRNGNKLAFTDAAITSSSGQKIAFERDPQGRITAAVDPSGKKIRYAYDAQGDLISVTDRENNVTRLQYRTDRPHYLEKVIDPLGREGLRSIYDPVTGRLQRLLDATGKSVDLSYDIDHFIYTSTDQLGNPTQYEYDARGNIVTEVDAEGGVKRYTYDAHNNTLSETIYDGIKPDGVTTTYTYDPKGNKLTETDALGHVTRYTYDVFGNVVTTIDALGQVSVNQYDGTGNLTSMTDSASRVTQITFDAHGNPLSMSVPGTGDTTFVYDGAGQLIQQTDALGNTTAFTYDDNGNQLTESRQQQLPGGGTRTVKTRNEYDNAGNLRFVRTYENDLLKSQTETRYNAAGKRTEEIDALGRSTKFQYDDRGLLTVTIFPDDTPSTDGDNPRTQVEYDAAGRDTARIDELGRRTETVYDRVGRRIATILPDATPLNPNDNPRTQTVYDEAGRVVAEIDARGNRTAFGYDAGGQRTVTILPDDTPADSLDNPRLQTQYDELGRAIVQTDPLGYVTHTQYDASGRPLATVFADGTTKRTLYDDVGHVSGRVDQAGRETNYEYDAIGRLTAVVQPPVTNPATGIWTRPRTEYEYNEAGQLVVQRDAVGRETRYEYDGQGRRTATVLPLGQRFTTAYDVAGNVLSTTDFNGATIHYEHDARDRLVAKRYPDGSSVTFTYTATGQQATVTDSRGTTSFAYDAQDRLLQRTDPDGVPIYYTYDAVGNRTSVTAPSGTTVYTFDAQNRLDTVTDPSGGVTTYEYDLGGELTSTSFPNGSNETRQYDSVGHLTFLENAGPSGVINSFRYQLDPTGNRQTMTEQDGRHVAYQYDNLYRLVAEDIFDSGAVAPTRAIDYIYDLVGNRMSRADSAEGTTSYGYDANDRLLTESLNDSTTRYDFDANGNTLRKVNAATDAVLSAYKWDFDNRLVGADADGNGTYEVQNRYDAEGIRVSQTVNGIETRHLIDKVQPYAQVLEEYSPGGIIKVSYVYGNDLISQNRPAETGKSFYHVDGLGSTRALTNSSGLVTDRYVYDAFGRTIGQVGSTGNVYLFAGEQRDGATGWDYLRARWMNRAVGRFVSRDVFPASSIDPLTLHRYAYAANNPVLLIDPTGQFSLGELNVVQAIQTVLTISGNAYRGVQTFKSVRQAVGFFGFLAFLGVAAVEIESQSSTFGQFSESLALGYRAPEAVKPAIVDAFDFRLKWDTKGHLSRVIAMDFGDAAGVAKGLRVRVNVQMPPLAITVEGGVNKSYALEVYGAKVGSLDLVYRTNGFVTKLGFQVNLLAILRASVVLFRADVEKGWQFYPRTESLE